MLDKEKVLRNFLKIWKTGHPKYYETLIKAAKIHEKKNSDYSGDKDPLKNLTVSESIGIPSWIGCEIRLMDKYSRMVELTRKIKNCTPISVKSEPLEDTFLDLANYALLCYVLYTESRTMTKEDTATTFKS